MRFCTSAAARHFDSVTRENVSQFAVMKEDVLHDILTFCRAGFNNLAEVIMSPLSFHSDLRGGERPAPPYRSGISRFDAVRHSITNMKEKKGEKPLRRRRQYQPS